MMAVVILTGVILGMARVTGKMLHTIATSDRTAAAMELVSDRLEQVSLDPDYEDLEDEYKGTETGFPSLSGYTRTTTIVHTGGGKSTGPDYKRITVTVNGPGLLAPISRTVTVGAP
jgi:hypothetical protein